VPAGERFDIVVVGVQAGGEARSDLAADLSSLTGLPPHKVTLALGDGELIVHRSLPDGEARRAAASLRSLGADVEIRSTGVSEGMATLRAIVPPPAYGASARTRDAPAHVDPTRPLGRPPVDRISQRPRLSAFATGRAATTPRELQPASDRPGNGSPRVGGHVGGPALGDRVRSTQLTEAERLIASLEAAAGSEDGLEIVTLDGERSDPVEVKAPDPSADDIVREEPAPLPSRPSEDERLALDFEGARDLAAASTSARAVEIAQPVAPVRTSGPRGIPEALRHQGNPLLSRDAVANYVFGVAVGLGLGLVIAFVAVRVWHRPDVLALEQELAESHAKPIEVASGQRRVPTDVERDLDARYGDSRVFFLLAMVLVGVPVGLGIGRVRL
jgi:hypothetical protein